MNNSFILDIKTKEHKVRIDSYTNWFKLQLVPTHLLSYLDFGRKDNPNVVICAHGLTRNAYDFTKIASRLSNRYRVISLSYPGRGNSDYFTDYTLYNYQIYMQDTLFMLDKLNIHFNTHNIIWLGTSMGGIIGMTIASRYKNLFKALILNDIGPFIGGEVLARIVRYASQMLYFNNLLEATAYVKMIYSQFGITHEEDWQYLVATSFILNEQGKYHLNYDVNITKDLESDPAKVKDVELWNIWDQITTKMLVVRGMLSNILLKNTITEMQSRNKFDLYNIENAGHAPALVDDEQISTIISWINSIS